MSWLDDLIAAASAAGIRFAQAGTLRPFRKTINIVSGGTVADDPSNDRTNITLSGSVKGNALPQNLGTPTAGVSTAFAADDHAHAHGAQLGGSLHANASTSVAGFLSAADKTKLDGVDLAELADLGDTVAGLAADLELSSGGDDTGRLQAKLDAAGHRLVLEPKVYFISSPLIIPSGGQILGNGATILPHSDWDDSSVDPDDRSDSMLSARGVVTGTVSTTLDGTIPAGKDELELDDASDVEEGMYLRLAGSYETDSPTSDSYTGESIEIVRVASVAGSVVTLEQSTRNHHADGCVVQSCTPVVGVRISDLALNPGDKTIPVGIEVTNAIDGQLDTIGLQKFSRVGIDYHGAHDFLETDCTDHGGSNAGARVTSSHSVHIHRRHATGRLGRQHAEGVTRHHIMIDGGCSFAQVHGFDGRHIPGALRIWGGRMCGGEDIHVSDIDGTEIILRAPADERIGGDPGAGIGLVFDGGCGPLNDHTAFTYGGFFRDVTARDVTQSATAAIYHHMAISWHDARYFEFSGVQMSQGFLDTSVGGIELVDVSGVMTNVDISGFGQSLRTRNTEADLLLDLVRIDGRADWGNPNLPGQYAFSFGTLGVQGNLKIGTLYINNYLDPQIHFTSDWTGSPNRKVVIDRLYVDDVLYPDVGPYPVTGLPTRGQVLRNTGGNLTIENTGPTRNQLICASYPQAGWCLAARGGGRIAHSSTAAVSGDALYAHSDGTARVSNTEVHPGTKWIAVAASSGGYCDVRLDSHHDGAITTTSTVTALGFVGVSLTGAGAGALALVGNNIGFWDGADLLATMSLSGGYATLQASQDGLNLSAARNVLSSSVYNLITHAGSGGQNFLDSNDTQIRNWAANKILISAHDNGVCVGAVTESSQNGSLRLAQTGVPSAAPSAGIDLWTSAAGALLSRDESNLYREITAADDAGTGAASKRIIRRFDRKTLTSATTVSMVEVLAADLPSGAYSARAECVWGAYDTTASRAASGRVGATVRRSSGTTVVVTSGANQEDQYSEEAGSGLSNTHPLIEQSGGNLRLTVGLKDPNTVHFWAEITVHVVEH